MFQKTGGKKKTWKLKGRLPVRKQYQIHCREQYKQRLVPRSDGGWMSVDMVKDSCIRKSWEMFLNRL